MPFLRAALLKKKPEPEIVLQPQVIEEQQPELDEEEFEPAHVDELHRIIEARGLDAERKIIIETIEAEAPDELLPETEEKATEEIFIPVDEETSENETLTEEFITPVDEEPSENETLTEEFIAPVDEETSENETLTEEIITPVDEEPSENEALTEEIITPADEETLTPELPKEIAEALDETESATVSHKDYSGEHLDYDFTSGERYVDKVSTKTEFDKMLDELSAISKDLLSWQTEKFARDYTEKFSDEGESSVAEMRKYEAFLGGYITNAAMTLCDLGYMDSAIRQLEQAINILKARKKLEDETSAIKSRVEEQNDAVDLSDILGLFGDG